MGLSLGHLIVVLLIVLVVFGAGKLPRVMGDFGKGLRALKDGMKDDADAPTTVTTIESADKDKAA